MSDRPPTSKKPSGTRAEQLLDESTFFTDECLGRHHVADALRAAGLRVEKHCDHFADGVDDVAWLPVVGGRGWVVLTKDKAIRRRPWEMDAVITAGVRMFTLTGGSMGGDKMAQAFLANRLRMGRLLHRCRFPFVAAVSRSAVALVRGGPPG